jgi:adhesin/invasin
MSLGSFSSTPSAQADTTAVVNVHCRLLLSMDFTPLPGPVAFNPCADDFNAGYAEELAEQIGDEDDTLEASDFESFAGFDGNQLSETCTSAALFCTNLIFVFVNDEAPVELDNDSGLASAQSPATTDFICNTENVAAEVVGAAGDLLADNDCSDPVASNGDGVVVFHVLNAATGGAERGDTPLVRVEQEQVEQSTTVNVVGTPNDVVLSLVETTIGTSGSVANSDDCTTDVDVTDAVAPHNATLAFATVYDEDDRELTMIPVDISVQPPSDDPSIAQLGLGDPIEEIIGDSGLTVFQTDAPTAYYRVVCGGSGTGVTDIVVQIDDGDADVEPDDDTSTVELTVVGAPSSVVLTAAPAMIACDGVTTSTVTAVVTDSAGNPVAGGTPIRFDVVALGTANPISTTTDDTGTASSVITPLSNASAGVTVLVTAGDASVATPVEVSTRVDCALPIDTQPSPGPTTPSGTVTPPDTGTGTGDQDGGFLSLWTLVALAIGGTVLVTGGLVARRNER